MIQCNFHKVDIIEYLFLTAFTAFDHSNGNKIQKDPLAYICKASQSVVYVTGTIYMQEICVN